MISYTELDEEWGQVKGNPQLQYNSCDQRIRKSMSNLHIDRRTSSTTENSR
jgi:hypothetical protein